MKRLSFICTLCLVTWTAVGQVYDLKPRAWFPLEVGFAWHFQDSSLSTESVVAASRDSLIDGDRWVGLDIKWCSGPACCTFCDTDWYRWTSDDYIMYRSFTGAILKLAPTTPYSIFRVNVPHDSTLASPIAFPPHTRREGFADVYVTVPPQIEPDSTNITMAARFGMFVGDDQYDYIYNVGPGKTLGAVLGDRRFGDTSRIDIVLSREEESRSEVTPVNIYPNPTSTSINISFDAIDRGEYALSIVDLVGRALHSETVYLSDGESFTWSWYPRADIANGAYFIEVKNALSVTRETAFVLR